MSDIIELAAYFRRGDTKNSKLPSPEEGLRLIRAFAKITDPARRQEIIAMVQKVSSGDTENQG
jgi:hypothetical protein